MNTVTYAGRALIKYAISNYMDITRSADLKGPQFSKFSNFDLIVIQIPWNDSAEWV